MAITVSGKNYSVISGCESTSDGGAWTGVDTQDGANKKEGSYSLCGTLKGSGNNDAHFVPSASIDLSGTKHVRFWLILTQGSLVNTYAGGGIQFYASDGSNTGYWYVGGKDTYPGGWHNFVVDVSKAVDSGTKPTNMNAITSMGVRINLTGVGKNVDNTWIDNLCTCDGLITYGDNAGGYYDFEDIFAICDSPSTGGWGILTKKAGTYCLTGSIEFGDASGTNGTKFQAKSQVVVFENRPNDDDTLSNINSNLMGFTIVDNGTGTTEFILGSKSGTQGIEGCTIRVQNTTQIAKYDIDASTDTDVDNFKLYGSTFLDADSISLPLTSANVEVLSCSFESCSEVLSSTCKVEYCKFVSANSRGLRISSTSHNVAYCDFISCTYGVHFPNIGTYSFVSMKFNGNTTDVENTSGGLVTVECDADSNPITFTGNTDLKSVVSLAVHVINEDGNSLEQAQVYIQKATPTAYTSDAGNNAGDADFIINEVVDTDVPQTGWLIILNKALSETTPYRYASWNTKTFTLRSEVTGTADTGGSSTTLKRKTGTGFLSADIEEGDTIRNTTDGSWAVVDEIIDDDTIITSAFQGGTDDTWEENDAYSVHRLALNYADNNDIVDIPLMNEQTNASGDASKNYKYTAPLAINIRIRSNYGSTKYKPYKTSGSVTGSGYPLTAVLLEDEVAT